MKETYISGQILATSNDLNGREEEGKWDPLFQGILVYYILWLMPVANLNKLFRDDLFNRKK